MVVNRKLRVLPALIALAGCSGPRAAASVGYVGRPELPPSAIAFTVTAGWRAWQFQGVDSPAAPSSWRSREFDTPTTGRLVVRYELRGSNGVASSGETSLDLHGDWRWSVDVRIDSMDPARTCWGCNGSQSFPLAAELRRTAADSVWMVWAGNSISHPVAY